MPVPLPFIQVRGPYREIGRQIGEAARTQIRRSLAHYEANMEWLAGMTAAEAEQRSLALLPYAERHLPQYVEELTGMAEGAGVPLVKLLVLNCGEETLCAPRPADRCTCLALTSQGRTVVGHNEDWIEADVENMVLLEITAPDGTRILSLTGAAYMPMCGVNSHGIAFVGNTLYARDERAGVPNSFKHRWMLEARRRDEADARACMAERARGSNHLFAQAGGRIWDIETSAAARRGHRGETCWLAHTNHFTAEEMLDVERSEFRGLEAAARESARAGSCRDRARRRSGRAGGRRAARPRQRAHLDLRAPRARRPPGRSDHGQPDLRARRTAHARLRRATVRERVPRRVDGVKAPARREDAEGDRYEAGATACRVP